MFNRYAQALLSVTVLTVVAAGTAGAALSGTATVAATNGVATFSGLSIDKSGAAYQLHATDGLLAAGDSSAFNVTAILYSVPSDSRPGSSTLTSYGPAAAATPVTFQSFCRPWYLTATTCVGRLPWGPLLGAATGFILVRGYRAVRERMRPVPAAPEQGSSSPLANGEK